ncbi:MAG TPA: imidazolonepropionase, partial [Dongiaceae bacterium]
MWDSLWTNGRLATMAPGAAYGAREDAALAVQDGRIAWIGAMRDLPREESRRARATHDLRGRWVTPGFLDCHTHLVYGGNRAHEFEQRLGGATYEQIARAGGGIRSTVAATRAASEQALIDSALPRL